MSYCLFCAIGARDASTPNPEDIPMEESERFLAKPGLGPLEAGYTLVLPRRHSLSFAALTADELAEADDLTYQVVRRLYRIFAKPIVMFEHGEASPTSHSGSCVEHAHLHLVPTEADISNELAERFDTQPVDRLQNLPSLVDGESYIYYRPWNAVGLAAVIRDILPCQFLRRMLSERIGRPDEWDWEMHPNREMVQHLLLAYRADQSLPTP